MHQDGTIDVRSIRGGDERAWTRRAAMEDGIGTFRRMRVCPTTTAEIRVVRPWYQVHPRRPRMQPSHALRVPRRRNPPSVSILLLPVATGMCFILGWWLRRGSSTTIPSISVPTDLDLVLSTRVKLPSRTTCLVHQTCLNVGPRVVPVARQSHLATHAREIGRETRRKSRTNREKRCNRTVEKLGSTAVREKGTICTAWGSKWPDVCCKTTPRVPPHRSSDS
mmetsp:Transcript_3194/g.19747  ORF Transcript_3194/g.19747 Transcript_3194/m.19747 type:complete len:222 (+) Transcript_3194:67-732(+)